MNFLSNLQILTPLLRSCSGQDVTKHTTFLPRCTSSGAFQEIQCDSGQCWCVDSQGHEVLGSRTAGRPSRCPSLCERQQWSALNMRKNMAAGAEIYVPVCSEDGDFLPLQCVGSHCFCVDAKGNNVSPAGGAVSCKISIFTIHTKHFTTSHDCKISKAVFWNVANLIIRTSEPYSILLNGGQLAFWSVIDDL